MRAVEVLPSTTSHKHEALLPTLAVFGKLGFTGIDLNLNHIVERGVDAEAAADAIAANGLTVRMVSGGWCDFFEDGAAADATRRSVDRQAALAHHFAVNRLRLFFGRLPPDECTREAVAVCARNVRAIADAYPDLRFGFENHDGASSRPEICRAVLDAVDRPNVRLTFDPINFEHRGVEHVAALSLLLPYVAHVHLKGRQGTEFCGFGEGNIDLTPALRTLAAAGYSGGFTVEYEGPGDRTIRLYESVRRARAVLDALFDRAQ
jgi:sugar phosphate isomerase/epimerase